MGFKTFIKNAWDYGKQGLSKIPEWGSNIGESVTDTWTKGFQPWLEESIGTEAIQNLGKSAGNVIGGLASEAAGTMASAIPFIGPLITPIAKLGAHAYYGGKTHGLIAPKKSKQTSNQTESKKSPADNPPAPDPPVDVGPPKNRKPPNNSNNNLPPNSPSHQSTPISINQSRVIFSPSAAQKYNSVRARIRARKNGRISRQLLAIGWDGYKKLGKAPSMPTPTNPFFNKIHPYGSPSVFGGNRG